MCVCVVWLRTHLYRPERFWRAGQQNDTCTMDMSPEDKMDEFNKKLKEIQDKAAKYDHMKGRYEQIAHKVKEGIDVLKEALEMIDPITGIKTKTITEFNYKEAAEEIYNEMKIQGKHISHEDIEKRLPEEPAKTHDYLFYMILPKMLDVKKRRENKILKLYIGKEY